MATRVIMPHMGLTTVEGTVVEWLVREGDTVEQGQPLVEILTDKVSTQVEAPTSGSIIKIVVPKDSVVQVTEALCWIGAPGEGVGDAGRAAQAEAAPDIPPVDLVKEAKDKTALSGYVKASPVAKRLAREHHLDLSAISGSGPGQRVVEVDVLTYMKDQLALQGSEGTAGVAGPPEVPEVSLAPSEVASTATAPSATSRRHIDTRAAESSRAVAAVTLTTEADVTEAMRIHEDLASEIERTHGIRPTFSETVTQVVAKGLRQYPAMNARFGDTAIEVLDEINVGITVATSEQQVVPVIRNADRKDLPTIARETRDRTARAEAGTLTRDDLAGGTFTITNLGAMEIDIFTPIVNAPETGVLGVGRISPRPAVVRDEIQVRTMMFLSLTFDHRVIDGAPAAEFLRGVKRALEEPQSTLGEWIH